MHLEADIEDAAKPLVRVDKTLDDNGVMLDVGDFGASERHVLEHVRESPLDPGVEILVGGAAGLGAEQSLVQDDALVLCLQTSLGELLGEALGESLKRIASGNDRQLKKQKKTYRLKVVGDAVPDFLGNSTDAFVDFDNSENGPEAIEAAPDHGHCSLGGDHDTEPIGDGEQLGGIKPKSLGDFIDLELDVEDGVEHRAGEKLVVSTPLAIKELGQGNSGPQPNGIEHGVLNVRLKSIKSVSYLTS